ncbi:hypothetical protein [Pararobbsia silviterrae]|nr:hypothetical protein [Pararobbsia silviterrae]
MRLPLIAASLGAAAALAGCAVPPTPGQTSIISRLPDNYAYAAPVQDASVQTQSVDAAPHAPAGATAVPPLSDAERAQYAAIDRQVQQQQAQSMAAEDAARLAWYSPSYAYPAYYPAYYSSYYPAYSPAYYPYYASPVVVGGYYSNWGGRGCCWRGGSRWSVGVGFSSGWGW